jgi:hypothetical protein
MLFVTAGQMQLSSSKSNTQAHQLWMTVSAVQRSISQNTDVLRQIWVGHVAYWHAWRRGEMLTAFWWVKLNRPLGRTRNG